MQFHDVRHLLRNWYHFSSSRKAYPLRNWKRIWTEMVVAYSRYYYRCTCLKELRKYDPFSVRIAGVWLRFELNIYWIQAWNFLAAITYAVPSVEKDPVRCTGTNVLSCRKRSRQEVKVCSPLQHDTGYAGLQGRPHRTLSPYVSIRHAYNVTRGECYHSWYIQRHTAASPHKSSRVESQGATASTVSHVTADRYGYTPAFTQSCGSSFIFRLTLYKTDFTGSKSHRTSMVITPISYLEGPAFST
jgi:hypothetical protein